ncbi:MAG: MFS transporter [Clostridia bacterium]|nr:MFS transporter [Clostridia bacterium]
MSASAFKRTKFACYTAYFTMSSIFALPPLLFMIFRQMYGISYTLLGTLVLINFCTQLAIDLIFTFFSAHFNVKKAVRIMPLLTSLGLFVYAVMPMCFPRQAYAGLVIGTLLFSVSAGLSEVLLSPMIAAVPSENPQRDMSALHSLYAFGFFSVVVVSTLFFRLFGRENWMYLTMFWALLPILAAVLFMTSPIPEIGTAEMPSGKAGSGRSAGLWLCAACIFLGSCAENVMSNWISGFMESALKIDESLGDILGMATFAILLGTARILYAAIGRNIFRVLFLGMFGATVCYFVAGLATETWVAFGACILIGLFTSMLWPGTLIMMEENIPGAGVAAFALMASAGDLGASVSPQLMGVVVDTVSASGWAVTLGAQLNLTAEQIGMRTGVLVSAVFPALGTIVVLAAIRRFRKNSG